MKRRRSHQFNAVSALKDSRFLRFVKQNGNNRRSVYDQFHIDIVELRAQSVNSESLTGSVSIQVGQAGTPRSCSRTSRL